MNANAYGGELARCSSGSTSPRPRASSAATPDQLGFAYRRSNLGRGEVVARASFALEPAEPSR